MSKKKWLFSAPKYITPGVQNVPEEVQMAIWNYIASRRTHQVPLDYLQVFALRPIQKEGLNFQLIECRQEVPEYRDEMIVSCEKPVFDKIFVIDDVDHVTMLLANEY